MRYSFFNVRTPEAQYYPDGDVEQNKDEEEIGKIADNAPTLGDKSGFRY